MTGKPGWPAQTAWLALFLLPPAAALALWRQPASHHPVFAVALGVAYEAVAAAARFAGRVMGEVTGRWQKRLADYVDLALLRRVSRFDRQYRAFVLASLRFIDQKGLATVGPFTPKLADIFIDVSLVPRSPHLVRDGLLPDIPSEVIERRALREFLNDPAPVVLAVIGAPGSGKTTLLRHTARQLFQRRPARSNHKRYLPILLYLRDHAAAISANPEVTMTELLRSTLGELRAVAPDGWFEQKLRNGECVVLLDGLDEVARPEERRKVAAWTESQTRYYPGNDYVITSRPHGYRAAEIDGATTLQVRSFTAEQVSRFVHGWYLAVERHSTGADDDEITVRAQKEADNLLQRLERAPALHELAVNPLLLTMISNVHRYRGALPGSRADLFQEIVQVMLVRRQEAKELPVQLDGDKKEALLRGLAYAMMQQRISDLPRDEILTKLAPALKRLPRDIDAEGFLADVGSNGILIERETGLCCFAHHTLQEYLAAAHIRDKGLTSELAHSVDDPWWRETTLLYTARSDADPVIAAALTSGTITALALAFDCADQGSEFSEDLRDRLESLLSEVADPTTSQERRDLITAVLLTRHLHQQIQTKDGKRICTRPIDVRLYRLFRDDTHTPPPDGPPAVAEGTEPVSGIRASDATALIRWINTMIGGECTYRLPSHDEVDHPVVQRHIIRAANNQPWSIWTQSDHTAPELWVPPARCHPYRLKSDTLTDHLSKDLSRSMTTLTRLLLMRSAVTVNLAVEYLQQPDNNIFPADSFAVASIAAALERAQGRASSEYTSAFAAALDRTSALCLARSAGRLDRASAFRLAVHLALAIDRDLALDDASATDRAVDLALDLRVEDVVERARNLDLTISRDRDRDRAFAFALNRDLRRAIAMDQGPSAAFHTQYRAPDPVLMIERAVKIRCSRVMGSVFSQALSDAMNRYGNTHSDGWMEEFTKIFAEAAGIRESSYLVNPDTLSRLLADAVRMLKDGWAAAVGRRLQDRATRVFDRKEPLTSNDARAIRLMALALAAEEDTPNQQSSGEAFRMIAAGITWLERRVNADDPTTEMIVISSELTMGQNTSHFAMAWDAALTNNCGQAAPGPSRTTLPARRVGGSCPSGSPASPPRAAPGRPRCPSLGPRAGARPDRRRRRQPPPAAVHHRVAEQLAPCTARRRPRQRGSHTW